MNLTPSLFPFLFAILHILWPVQMAHALVLALELYQSPSNSRCWSCRGEGDLLLWPDALRIKPTKSEEKGQWVRLCIQYDTCQTSRSMLYPRSYLTTVWETEISVPPWLSASSRNSPPPQSSANFEICPPRSNWRIHGRDVDSTN